MAKIRVAVLAGGFSSEREISLRTGAMVVRNLDPERYTGELIDLLDLLPGGRRELTSLPRDFDVVFLALHGRGGEDGAIQGTLELLGLPYTGSGVLASALAMNKTKAKDIYRQYGIPTPPSQTFVHPTEFHVVRDAAEKMGFPVVIKAEDQGSSVGVVIVQNVEQLEEAYNSAIAYSGSTGEVLMEKFVKGTEVTCGVIGATKLEALPVVEIVPKNAFFDYEAKYTPGASDEIVPARISAEMTARIQELAIKTHKALGCWGVSRTDMLIEGDTLWVLETNTIPGLTEGSLLPKAARAAGIMLPELFDRLITFALKRPAMIRPQGVVKE